MAGQEIYSCQVFDNHGRRDGFYDPDGDRLSTGAVLNFFLILRHLSDIVQINADLRKLVEGFSMQAGRDTAGDALMEHVMSEQKTPTGIGDIRTTRKADEGGAAPPEPMRKGIPWKSLEDLEPIAQRVAQNAAVTEKFQAAMESGKGHRSVMQRLSYSARDSLYCPIPI